MAACNRQETPAAAPPAPADAWATVDGRHILAADVEKAFQRTRDPNVTLSSEEIQAAKMTLLEDLITQDLLLAKARELMIDVTPAEIDQAVTQARGEMTDEQFQQELTRRGLAVGDVRESVRRDLIVQKVLDREVSSKVTISDAEVTTFFETNRQQFNLPEDAYHLAQIVVTPVREPQPVNATGSDAASPQEVQQKVNMLMDRIRAGESFSQLAMQFSEDPETSVVGGDLGLIPLSAIQQASPTMRNTVLRMTPGNAAVVNENGAAAIIFLVAKEPAGQRDLSTPGVREQITEALRARRETLLRNAYLTQLRTEARITNHAARRVIDVNGKV